MEQLIQDVRYGLRGFIRQPAFALTAILALALGIGANTAVFSVVDGVLLKPLPFPHPEQLVYVHDTYPAVTFASVSFPKLVALREQNHTLVALGGHSWVGLTLTGSGEPEQVPSSRVTAELFKALAVQPLHGRWFTADEDRPSGPPAIILGYALWQRRFGGDPRVVGQAIPVDGGTRTVVGVMPPGFTYPGTTQAWVPLALSAAVANGENFMRLVGRLRDGVSLEQAQQDLAAVSDAYNKQNGLLRAVKVWRLHDIMVTTNRRLLLVLQGAVAFVLLVACANVANLLLARSVTRRRELAIRAAIGAQRARIVRQLLTESVMLSGIAAIVGVLLASWLLRLFLSMAPAGFPRLDAVGIDRGVLLFTLAVAMVTGLVFGVAPARQGFKANPNDSLRDTGARGATAGSTRGASRALVIAEVALALVLVIGAGLMVKSLLRLQGEDTGFRPAGLLTFDLNLPQARYSNNEPREFYRRLLDEIRAIPGVESAAAINYVPLTTFGYNGPFSVVGQPPFDPRKAPVTEYRFTTPGYFATMGIALRRGQDFTERNNETDRPVVIVNESLATQYFGGADPIGTRIRIDVDASGVQREVIGVVADVRDWQVGTAPVPEVFIPHAQVPLNGMGMAVRIGGMRPDLILPSIRQRLAQLDPEVAIVRPRTMDSVVQSSTGGTRMTSILTGLFALVAALLASVGIFSLIAISVAQRTREIGIRVALGADRGTVMRMVIGEGLTLAAAGIGCGLAGSVFLTRALESLLYEVSPTDPTVLAATCVGVLLVAAVASLVPALRALRVDPMIALRAE